MRRVSKLGRFYTVIGQKRLGDDVHTLIRFDLPEMSNTKRRALLEAVMNETSADALVECFWTRGSVIHKDQRHFDAVLIEKSSDKT